MSDTTTVPDHPFPVEAKPESQRAIHGGVQYRFEFPNGYGASVVRHDFSYGSHEGCWELGVTKNRSLTYDTAITDDVIGWLDEVEVAARLRSIASLPAVSS